MAKTLRELRRELMIEDSRLTRRINEDREEVMKLEKVLDRRINRRNDVRMTINAYERLMSEHEYPPTIKF